MDTTSISILATDVVYPSVTRPLILS